MLRALGNLVVAAGPFFNVQSNDARLCRVLLLLSGVASASGAGGYGGGGTDEESVGGPNYATVMDARAL